MSETFAVELSKPKTHLRTFENTNQADLMQEVVNYLINHHNFAEKLPEIPYSPGRKTRAIINSDREHPDGKEMLNYRELDNGLFLDTHVGRSDKKLYLQYLAAEANVDIQFKGPW